MQTKVSPDKIAAEYLAAERTFLAWVRTSIAVITLGFVVAKFGVWLRELATRMNPNLHLQSTGISLPMGAGMMGFGAVLAVLAAWHYHRINLAIERGEVRANRGLVVTVTVGIATLALLMILYVFLAAKNL